MPSASLPKERPHVPSFLVFLRCVRRHVGHRVFDGGPDDFLMEGRAGRATRSRIPWLLCDDERKPSTSFQPAAMDGLQPHVDRHRDDALFRRATEEAESLVAASCPLLRVLIDQIVKLTEPDMPSMAHKLEACGYELFSVLS